MLLFRMIVEACCICSVCSFVCYDNLPSFMCQGEGGGGGTVFHKYILFFEF